MKAHRTDLVSFVFGLLFVGLALWWLLAQILGLALPAVGWFLAGALVLIGLLGLVGAVRSARTTDVGPPAGGSGPTPTPAPASPTPTPAPAGPTTDPAGRSVGGPTGSPPDGPAGGSDDRAGWRDTAELRPGDPADEPGRPGTVERRPGQDEPTRIGDGNTLRWPADDPVTGPPGTPSRPPS